MLPLRLWMTVVQSLTNYLWVPPSLCRTERLLATQSVLPSNKPQLRSRHLVQYARMLNTAFKQVRLLCMRREFVCNARAAAIPCMALQTCQAMV